MGHQTSTMKSLLTSLRRLKTTKNLLLVCLLLKVKINNTKDRNQPLLLMIKVLRKWACPFKKGSAALVELMIEKRKKKFFLKFRDSNPFCKTNSLLVLLCCDKYQ